MMDTWTPLKLIAWTQGYLARSGVDAPRLTAELLLARALSCDRVRLYLDFDKPLGAAELAAFRDLVRRRAEGEPTAYLTGVKEFHGRAFHVDGRVLVPRPETELLAEAALEAFPPGGAALDLCTGSGVLGITLALERPGTRVVAADVSGDAVDVARANAARLGASIDVRQGDLFEAVAAVPFPFDVVVANPPYVPSGELPRLSREIQREPRLALDGGPDGLSVIRRIVAEAPFRLAAGGTLLVEMHESHAEVVPRLCLEAGMVSAEARKDLAGLPRYAVARAAG